jgi:hypothetical protein
VFRATSVKEMIMNAGDGERKVRGTKSGVIGPMDSFRLIMRPVRGSRSKLLVSYVLYYMIFDALESDFFLSNI